METVANILLISGTMAATFYCRVLALRVSKLKVLNKGLDSAILSLSNSVEILRSTLQTTLSHNLQFSNNLAEVSQRAEIAAGRLHILLSNTVNVKLPELNDKAIGPQNVFASQQLPVRLRSSTNAFIQDPKFDDRNHQNVHRKDASLENDSGFLVMELKQALGVTTPHSESIR